jgi:tRNA-dihydrouridine synthase B
LGLADAREALTQSGAAAVMIGRGAMGKPWLIGEIAAGLAGRSWHPPANDDMAGAAVAHYQFLLSAFGARQGLRHARKHVVAYLEEAARLGSGQALALRATLCQSENAGEVERGLATAFSDIPVRRVA